ncbi:HIT family protein [Candidatus Woesearchaeota archaeon]|nr:HIT family protein [Candidatus Woesearchaeota archaeon]
MTQVSEEQLKQIEEYLKTLPEPERQEKEKQIMAQLEQQGPPQCPFCLMSEGKIETTKLYEDEHFIVVLEINPANKGHTILIPKRHIKHIYSLNNEESEKVINLLKKFSASLSVISQGVNILYSEGPASGQKFEHLAINLIPRYTEDSVKIQWQPKKAEKTELEKVKQEIISHLPIEEPKAPKIDTDNIKKELEEKKKRLP